MIAGIYGKIGMKSGGTCGRAIVARRTAISGTSGATAGISEGIGGIYARTAGIFGMTTGSFITAKSEQAVSSKR